jgi:prepilin-type N-terminal cleavage/methylation domain-containing protein
MMMGMGTRTAARGRGGFSLLELLVVIGILALLIGMVTTVIIGVKDHQRRAEAKLTLQEFSKGMISLKMGCNIDPGTPVGVFGGGQTSAGTTDFTDLRRDFAADGIAVGDELFILDGAAQGKRTINGLAGKVLSLSGASFTKSERSLTYFLIKSSGEAYPLIHPARELHPTNTAWAGSFTPHLNHRKIPYFNCPAGKVRDGWFRDPWGTPYAYGFDQDGGAIIERLVSAGRDRKFGTDDDIEKSVAEIPFEL